MALKGKSKSKWVVLDDCEDEDSQITEVMPVGEVGCLVRCTDLGEEDGDRPAVVFVPGAKLSDFVDGEPEDDDDDDDDDD